MRGLAWSDERYVRVYTRDTAEWLVLSFHAQSVYLQIRRKLDRDGVLRLGRIGRRAVAVAIGRVELWESVIEPALRELEGDGWILVTGGGPDCALTIPDFVDSEEAPASAAARKAAQRERERLAREAASRNVTSETRSVTGSHECHPVPYRAVPSRAVPEEAAPPPASPPPEKPKRATRLDPLHTPLTARLAQSFVEVCGTTYGHAGGKDARAVTTLLRHSDGNIEEVDRRWRVALALPANRWPGCRSIAQLAARWNDFAPPPTRNGHAEPDPLTQAIVRHEGSCPPWSAFLREAAAAGTQAASAASACLAGLQAEASDGHLRLTASDPYAAQRIRDVFAPAIARSTGLGVEVLP